MSDDAEAEEEELELYVSTNQALSQQSNTSQQ